MLKQCRLHGYAVVRTGDGASLAPLRPVVAAVPGWLKTLLGKYRGQVIGFLDETVDGGAELDVTPEPKDDDPITPLMRNWIETGTGSYGHRPEQLAPARSGLPGRARPDPGPGGGGKDTP